MIKNLVIPGPDGEANLEIPSALHALDPFGLQVTRETIIHLELEPKTARALKDVLFFIEEEAAFDAVLANGISRPDEAAAARWHLLEDNTWGRLYSELLAAGERTSWDHNDYDA